MIDARKQGLMNGLRQADDFGLLQLLRHLNAGLPVLLDRDAAGHANYSDGVFCPLAIALDLDVRNYRDDVDIDQCVVDTLTAAGLKIYNTRGIKGEFYTSNRREDLVTALREILHEKGYQV